MPKIANTSTNDYKFCKTISNINCDDVNQWLSPIGQVHWWNPIIFWFRWGWDHHRHLSHRSSKAEKGYVLCFTWVITLKIKYSSTSNVKHNFNILKRLLHTLCTFLQYRWHDEDRWRSKAKRSNCKITIATSWHVWMAHMEQVNPIKKYWHIYREINIYNANMKICYCTNNEQGPLNMSDKMTADRHLGGRSTAHIYTRSIFTKSYSPNLWKRCVKNSCFWGFSHQESPPPTHIAR